MINTTTNNNNENGGRNMRVETNAFFNAHGKNPRGVGGWWFNLLDGDRRCRGDFQFFGMFTEAKRAAVAKAREVGATTVQVLS